jgi:hypothetical protein
MATIVKIDPPKHLLAKHVECGATIQYDIREVREVYYADYGGGGDTYYEAVCPHYGKTHQWSK